MIQSKPEEKKPSFPADSMSGPGAALKQDDTG